MNNLLNIVLLDSTNQPQAIPLETTRFYAWLYPGHGFYAASESDRQAAQIAIS